ncbi:MAG: hypothetical protein ACREJC_13845 [Tepidisphaeraceae bacterium]
MTDVEDLVARIAEAQTWLRQLNCLALARTPRSTDAVQLARQWLDRAIQDLERAAKILKRGR